MFDVNITSTQSTIVQQQFFVDRMLTSNYNFFFVQFYIRTYFIFGKLNCSLLFHVNITSTLKNQAFRLTDFY